MPISFTCQKCSFQTKVKDELAGKKIKCPKCQTVGQVAAAVAEPDEDVLPLAGLEKLNLEKYKDVEPDEDEEDSEEEEIPEPKSKGKAPAAAVPGKGKKRTPPPISGAAKALASFFVISGLAAMAMSILPLLALSLAITAFVLNPPDSQKQQDPQEQNQGEE